MKILIVSNLYPPHYMGGYELHCAQVAEALHESGHDVRVLTSVYGVPRGGGVVTQGTTELHGPVPVYRRLKQYALRPRSTLRPWTPFRARNELSDARLFLQLLEEFRPDVVNWWNMFGLTKLMLPIPHRLGIPTVHAIDDNWLIQEFGAGGAIASAFWNGVWDGDWGPPVLRPLLRLLGRRWEARTAREGIPTRQSASGPGHACFLSWYLLRLHEEAGIACSSAEVIHGGVQVDRFYGARPFEPDHAQPVRILYAGQVTPDRGLHTLIAAITYLAPEIQSQVRLTVAGGGQDEYVSKVKEQVRSAGLADRISFMGKVLHAELPAVYKSHDLFVFASSRQEGFGFVMVEAMLAGCAVLTTGSGGSQEIARAADLPQFPAGDARALSHLLAAQVTDRAGLHRIAVKGQAVALREFTFDRMMEKWNASLRRFPASRSGTADGGPHGSAR